MLIDTIIIICWLSVIALFLLSGFIFIRKSRDREKTKVIRRYLLSIGLFFILYSVNRIIFFIHELFFDPMMWSMSLQEYHAIMVPGSFKFDRYDVIWRVSTAIGSIGLLIFLIGFESQILEKKTFFILSIIQGVTLTLSLILGAAGDRVDIGKIILYLGLAPALVVPFIYIGLAVKGFGAARTRALGAGFGFLLFYLGIAVNSSFGKTIFNYLWDLEGIQFSYIIYAVLIAVGIFIYMRSIRY